MLLNVMQQQLHFGVLLDVDLKLFWKRSVVSQPQTANEKSEQEQ